MSLPHHKRKRKDDTQNETTKVNKRVCTEGHQCTADVTRRLEELQVSIDDLRQRLYDVMYGEDSTEVDEEDPEDLGT